jgi:hypothetical protein
MFSMNVSEYSKIIVGTYSSEFQHINCIQEKDLKNHTVVLQLLAEQITQTQFLVAG